MQDITGIEPMAAKVDTEVPVGEAWRWEPKWDGYRALLSRAVDGSAKLTSRRGTDLADAFPELIAAAVSGLPIGTTLDGEVVCWTGGKLDFEALQRRYANRRSAGRLSAQVPCHFIAFDVLRTRAGSVMGEPLWSRRERLEKLLAEVSQPSSLSLGMQTADRNEALEWARTLTAVGVEGLVAKPARSRYLPGQRGPWLKIKAYSSVEVIVGGVTGTLDRPERLIFGRMSSTENELVVAGQTTPLSDKDAVDLAAVIELAGDDHPWPAVLPSSPFGTSPPRQYIRIRPASVVEVRVDPATLGGTRWRHIARYLRLRLDRHLDDVPLDLEIE